MPDPLIRKRTPAEILRYVAERLREEPNPTALIAHSLTLDMLAEELPAESDPPRTEWANRLEHDGRREVVPVGPEREGGGEAFARRRLENPWHTALLRRTVSYGPWVEVPTESEIADA